MIHICVSHPYHVDGEVERHFEAIEQDHDQVHLEVNYTSSTLKQPWYSRKVKFGQEKYLGKIMLNGISMLRVALPSTTWISWISVASDILASLFSTFSTLISCKSIVRMSDSHSYRSLIRLRRSLARRESRPRSCRSSYQSSPISGT